MLQEGVGGKFELVEGVSGSHETSRGVGGNLEAAISWAGGGSVGLLNISKTWHWMFLNE